MDDFGMLTKDFGFRPQGKSAPMKSNSGDRRNRPASSSTSFAAEGNDIFNDVFGGPPKYSNNNSKSTPSIVDFDYDSIFKDSVSANNIETITKPTSLNSPVYDTPRYDDEIFDGLPGMKSKPVSSSSLGRYEDNIFASMTTSPPKHSQQSDNFDDLLGNLGRTEKVETTRHHGDKTPKGFDDLIPGFGSGSPVSVSRWNSDPSPNSSSKTKGKPNALDDPFAVLESISTPAASSQGVFTDPLEEITKISKSKSTSGDVFGDLDSINSFNKPSPAFVKETNNNRGKGQTHSEEGSSVGSARSSVSREPLDESSFVYSEIQPQKTTFDDFQESHQPIFDTPTVSRSSRKSFDQTTSPPSHTETSSPKSDDHSQHTDDIWLTVSEVPLFTPVTKAPPPSRPPPPIPRRASKSERVSSNSTKHSQNVKSPVYSKLDDLESFAMGRMPNNNNDENSDARSSVEIDSNSASASMKEKETMDKFKHAKEVRERDNANASRNKEDEEEEREKRKVEKEKMMEIEREKARQAVERATREARERAASEARLKAERAASEARLKAERAAVQRAQAEARERAAIEARERAEKAAAEAKDRASAEKAEKAAAAEKAEKEAREKAAVAKAQAEARRRAERAAVERVTAEARERAAAEAREKAAAAASAKTNQQKSENDLDSFFNMGSQPSSVPKSRATSSESASDLLSQNRRGAEGAQRPSNVKKAASTTNFVDDLSSIFGGATPAGEFQDIEGETEERRRARLERQQRTQERAAKALAEKNQRDLQTQKEQEEKHRISATLDVEIKRWAAGKEGNLRAMLSTLQYVLWPECGWQPISLTDLITGASVKKAYRKATLCIHPDKVQQKGANLQQKYVAEKVFDLLKEAWNKFNSEELF